MNIKTLNQIGHTRLVALLSAAVLACASLYAVSAQDTEKKEKQVKIIKIKKDDSQGREIDIEKDGKQFVEKNGKRYVIENDQKRA